MAQILTLAIYFGQVKNQQSDGCNLLRLLRDKVCLGKIWQQRGTVVVFEFGVARLNIQEIVTLEL